MRAWFWTVLVLAAAVGAALLLRDHSGNLLILAGPWRIELSLTLAVIVLVVAFVLIYALTRLVAWVTGSPGRYRSWRGKRAHQRDYALLESGFVYNLEGRFDLADKTFNRLQGKTHSRTSRVLALLAGATAARQLGNSSRWQRMLTQAEAAAGTDARLKEAVAMVTAEALLDDNRAEEALVLLQSLQDATPRYTHAKRLALRAHQAVGNHNQVYELTRWLQKHHVLSSAEASRYLVVSVAARLQHEGAQGFKTIWKDLRPEEKTTPAIAYAAAQVLAANDQHDDAARVLEQAIDHAMDPQLLGAYSQCPQEQVSRRLSRAEGWLKRYPDNSALLAALGAICMKGDLWGPAERYLQRSMALRSDMRIHALLGKLYDGLDRPDAAARHWRLAADVAGQLPVVAAVHALPAADTRDDPTLIEIDADALAWSDSAAGASSVHSDTDAERASNAGARQAS